MTQYNSVHVKLFDSQLKKIKSKTKSVTEITLKLSSNMIDDSNDVTSFPHKLVLIDRQVSNLHNAFESTLSVNISKTQLSKTQQSKISQSGKLGRLYRQLIKFGLLLMKNVLKSLAKRVLIPL